MESNIVPIREGEYPSLDDIVPATELSLHAQRLIDYASRKGGRLPKGFDKASIVQQFRSTFELIGGVPRLALWADENPGQFYAMYSKLLPQVAKIEHAAPKMDEDYIKSLSVDELKAMAFRYLQTIDDVSPIDPPPNPADPIPPTPDPFPDED